MESSLLDCQQKVLLVWNDTVFLVYNDELTKLKKIFKFYIVHNLYKYIYNIYINNEVYAKIILKLSAFIILYNITFKFLPVLRYSQCFVFDFSWSNNSINNLQLNFTRDWSKLFIFLPSSDHAVYSFINTMNVTWTNIRDLSL